MYKPSIDDVQIRDWMKPQDKEELVALAILWLNGGSKNAKPDDGKTYNFGWQEPATLPLTATDEEKDKALAKAVSHLLDKFDIEKASKEQGYDGELNYLRPLKLADLRYYKEKKVDQTNPQPNIR